MTTTASTCQSSRPLWHLVEPGKDWCLPAAAQTWSMSISRIPCHMLGASNSAGLALLTPGLWLCPCLRWSEQNGTPCFIVSTSGSVYWRCCTTVELWSCRHGEAGGSPGCLLASSEILSSCTVSSFHIITRGDCFDHPDIHACHLSRMYYMWIIYIIRNTYMYTYVCTLNLMYNNVQLYVLYIMYII